MGERIFSMRLCTSSSVSGLTVLCLKTGLMPGSLFSIKEKERNHSLAALEGITLLEAVGKFFARLMLNRLNEAVLPNVLPEVQCTSRLGRGTC